MSHAADEQTNTVSIVVDQENENSFFTINSHKAAEILGVNRTRLSQLTSQGVFPYERRKVDARSRLYYRLNDLLNYQRRSSFGNMHANENYTSGKNLQTPLLVSSNHTHESQQTSDMTITHPKKLFISKHSGTKSKALKSTRDDRILMNAIDVQKKREHTAKLKDAHSSIKNLEEKYHQISEVIVRLEQVIGLLNTQILKRQKPIPRSPGVKRTFKFVKRRNFK